MSRCMDTTPTAELMVTVFFLFLGLRVLTLEMKSSRMQHGPAKKKISLLQDKTLCEFGDHNYPWAGRNALPIVLRFFQNVCGPGG